MTFSELEASVKRMKAKDLSCNLFPDFNPMAEFRIVVEKRGDTWEVYWCERGSSHLRATFANESALCEFIYSQYKSFHTPWYIYVLAALVLTLPVLIPAIRLLLRLFRIGT